MLEGRCQGCGDGGALGTPIPAAPMDAGGYLPSPKHNQGKGEAMGRMGGTPHQHPITTHSFLTALPWAFSFHGLSATYRGCPTCLQSTHGCWNWGGKSWMSPLGTTCPQARPHSKFVPPLGSLKISAPSSQLAPRAHGGNEWGGVRKDLGPFGPFIAKSNQKNKMTTYKT